MKPGKIIILREGANMPEKDIVIWGNSGDRILNY